MIGQIVETEAYLGESDRACHSWHGYTARTAPMYEEPGRAYLYFVYGMHWCLNVVTEEPGRPCAVLLRALAPVQGIEGRADGPGRICRALGLDGEWNRADLVGGPLRIAEGQQVHPSQIAVAPRVGVAYAGDWAERPLRFFWPGSPHVSRPSRRTKPRG
jgi:DNA-3-methyladenine glycosylase